MTIRVPLVAGLVGAVAFAVGLVVAPRQALFSYLAAWSWAATIAIGALVFVMIGHVMKATWTVVFRRAAEAIAGTLPLLALLFVPVLVGMAQLYPWAGPHDALTPEVHHVLAKKAAWLAPGVFSGRAVFYLAAWLAVAELLRRWSVGQDRAADPVALTTRMRNLSAAGLPLTGLTLTFAAFDWIMSLTPVWFSAIFGLYVWAGGFVAALGLTAVAGRATPALTASHSHALGKLTFAFVVFWAYMAYAQGFIIWIANKPEEVTWYLPRVAGSWGALFVIVVAANFVFPFAVLLSRDLKRHPRALAAVGGWLLLAHYLDVYWMILPVLHPGGAAVHWLDLAALLCVGGLAGALALVRLARQPRLPEADPAYAAALRYRTS